MGLSSKPLYIQVELSLFNSNIEKWVGFINQGHFIEVINEYGESSSPPIAIDQVVMPHGKPDIYLAPHAMRMTADMLKQLPSALDLAITGARTLRYGPTTKDPTAWKGAKKKNVKAAKPRKGKHSTVKAEAPIGGEHDASHDHQRDGGEVKVPVVETTNREGDHTTHEGSQA